MYVGLRGGLCVRGKLPMLYVNNCARKTREEGVRGRERERERERVIPH